MARNYKVGSLESFKANPLARGGVDVTIYKKSTTTVDEYGRVTGITEDAGTAGRIVIANITNKDLKISNSGLNIVGNMKIYFPYDLIVAVDDIIDDGTRRWRVKAITSTYPPVYGIGVVTAIDLNGSS
jgi:hypothetical protein